MVVTEVPVPRNGMDQRAVLPRAFTIEKDDGSIVGVMHSRKPANSDGTLALHISVSRSRWSDVLSVEPEDLQAAENAVLNAGLDWPAEVDLLPFTKGPFAGKGIHVWQKLK
jgi:hypothetical protein